ncbi:MAG: rod shape-determining protein [Firmicutes bacterium]|nr:rod shape-determining protein [Bacillota bacterium]MDY5531918.1 rod shape-determining protein [Pumilibacteraceae bacterium]
MSKVNIALDIGTCYTSVFVENQGIVLREPTLIAYTGKDDTRKLGCVGDQAADIIGKAPDNTTVVRPVHGGYISDPAAATMMLGQYLNKINVEKSFFTRINAVLAVPTGLSVEERKQYGDVCYDAGIANVDMVDNIMLSALSMNLPVDAASGSLVVNIGGGSTEIALISLCGIITGCSVSIGGDMMDAAICDYVVGKYGLRISKALARKIKEEIGSLYPNDNAGLEIKGVNSKTLVPATCTVYATDVYESLMPYYSKVSEAVRDVIKTCPKSFAADLTEKGVYVTGGASRILGLDRVMRKALDLDVHISAHPDYSACAGGGKLLSNRELLKRILGN